MTRQQYKFRGWLTNDTSTSTSDGASTGGAAIRWRPVELPSEDSLLESARRLVRWDPDANLHDFNEFTKEEVAFARLIAIKYTENDPEHAQDVLNKFSRASGRSPNHNRNYDQWRRNTAQILRECADRFKQSGNPWEYDVIYLTKISINKLASNNLDVRLAFPRPPPSRSFPLFNVEFYVLHLKFGHAGAGSDENYRQFIAATCQDSKCNSGTDAMVTGGDLIMEDTSATNIAVDEGREQASATTLDGQDSECNSGTDAMVTGGDLIMEDTSATNIAVDEGREQASATTLDGQDLMDAVQMLCNWYPGYCPTQSLSRKMRSFLALIRIAESYLRLEGDEAGADARLHGYLGELQSLQVQEPSYRKWRTNLFDLIRWAEREYWENGQKDVYNVLFNDALSSLENVEDIKRRLQKQLASGTSTSASLCPLIFILKNRNPRTSYQSIAQTFGSPSCVIDFLIWGIPVREAQIFGLAHNSTLLENGTSLFSPQPPFDPGQSYITVSLPKRLQEEILNVGKTLQVSTPKTSNRWGYDWSRALEFVSKVICKYITERKKLSSDEFSSKSCAVHQEPSTVSLVKGWYEIIAPTSRDSYWPPHQVLFDDQREEWTPEKLFIRNEGVPFSCQRPVEYISICIEIPTL